MLRDSVCSQQNTPANSKSEDQGPMPVSRVCKLLGDIRVLLTAAKHPRTRARLQLWADAFSVIAELGHDMDECEERRMREQLVLEVCQAGLGKIA